VLHPRHLAFIDVPVSIAQWPSMAAERYLLARKAGGRRSSGRARAPF
jgi:hypothetical protein